MSKKLKILNIIFSVFLLAVFLIPSITTFADDNVSNPPPGDGNSVSTKLDNPLKVDSIQGLITLILNAIIAIATPIVILFMIYAGFKYVMARGNPDKIKEAHLTLLYVIIGIAILLGAELISKVLEGTITELKAGLY